MTRLLQESGYRITFLFLAFEGPWYWGHDEVALKTMRETWDEVILVYGNRQIAQPPKEGTLHRLDEWWDVTLEHIVGNLARRRFFDVAVVHDVWLSKALDFLSPRTVKILETHDISWRRAETFARLGIKPEFFVTSEASELLGLRRADLAVTVQESEGAEILRKAAKPVINVPFYDPGLEGAALAQVRTHYLSPDKVTFGVLGSDNPFNVAGVDALLRSLEREISDAFAPVEVLVGGAMGDKVVPRVAVKCTGKVKSEEEFYARVDYAIAPVFDGTGFQVKAADALALHMPCILSNHAAQGISSAPGIVCATADDMARKMVEISLRRPSLTNAQALVSRARTDLRDGMRAGRAALIAFIEKASEPLVFDLTAARLDSDALLFQSYLSTVRVITAYRCVILLLADDVLNDASFNILLPLAVKAMSAAALERERASKHMIVIDVLGIKHPGSFKMNDGDLLLWDTRWCRNGAPQKAELGAFAGLPLFHSNVFWEPAAVALRTVWEKSNGFLCSSKSLPLRLIFVDLPLSGFCEEINLWSGFSTYLIPVSDWALYQRAAISILQRRAKEVIWAARPSGLAHRVILDVCGIYEVPFWGGLDEAAMATSEWAKTLPRELDQTVSRVIEDCIQRLSNGHDTKQLHAEGPAKHEAAQVHPQSHDEALVSVTTLPEGSHGFHRLEYNRNGSAFRWTGPGPECRFTLRINRTCTIVLTFRIISLGKNRASDLTVEVYGETYPLREVAGSKLAFAAGPLRAHVDSNPTEVTLRTPRLFQPSQDGSQDTRTLGVALAWIDVETSEDP